MDCIGLKERALSSFWGTGKLIGSGVEMRCCGWPLGQPEGGDVDEF
jgi:hypothetical protein